MRGIVLVQVAAAVFTAVVCQDVTPEYPEQGLQDEPIEVDQELPRESEEEAEQAPAQEPRPVVTVQPMSAPAESYVPAGVPPSGVIFSNGPAGNVQSFQVPGAGMALGEGKKVKRERLCVRTCRLLHTTWTDTLHFNQQCGCQRGGR